MYHKRDMEAGNATDAEDTRSTEGIETGRSWKDSYYGEEGIPESWRQKLAPRDQILNYAERLLGGRRFT